MKRIFPEWSRKNRTAGVSPDSTAVSASPESCAPLSPSAVAASVRGRMPGIKWNLFLSFLLFSAVLLVLLWIFQTVLLDHFYRSIKTRQIISTADILARNIEHEDLSVLIDQLSTDADVSIMVLSSSGQKIFTTSEQMGVLIGRMPTFELVRLISQTRQAGGSS
ncbi:MAG: hypothetical protein SCM11_11620, partial [Bacillota bacterium]|nr:hypothetical protein [Bacillota bacterium]